MPKYTKNGQSRASRAAQFMPFAALTGYYELARQQERVVEARHEPTDEEALALSQTIMQVRRGDLIRVTFYRGDGYVTRAGTVAAVDATLRNLRLDELTIPFRDIREIDRSPANGDGAWERPGV
ncbi:hypothetical protein [Collinsella vaginalis]|uniref:hypothetical protein n=1 Tax=Collinsella vaginalis TaxID=1870987 RepID=UPI000BE8C742|nr:hypothetical protein [Collinsella vaginalis]